MQAFFRTLQPGACTHYVGRFPTCETGGAYAKNLPLASFLNAAALTSLIREKTDVHAASFFNLTFFRPQADGTLRGSGIMQQNKLFFRQTVGARCAPFGLFQEVTG